MKRMRRYETPTIMNQSIPTPPTAWHVIKTNDKSYFSAGNARKSQPGCTSTAARGEKGRAAANTPWAHRALLTWGWRDCRSGRGPAVSPVVWPTVGQGDGDRSRQRVSRPRVSGAPRKFGKLASPKIGPLWPCNSQEGPQAPELHSGTRHRANTPPVRARYVGGLRLCNP